MAMDGLCAVGLEYLVLWDKARMNWRGRPNRKTPSDETTTRNMIALEHDAWDVLRDHVVCCVICQPPPAPPVRHPRRSTVHFLPNAYTVQHVSGTG